MSLLLANGHPHPRHYPVGLVLDEARLVRERNNHALASAALLLQQTVSSILSKEGGKQFSKTIKRLTRDGGK